MVGRNRCRAQRAATVAFAVGSAVRRFGRLLGHLGQPAGLMGRARIGARRRRRQSGRNRRADRRRALRAQECARRRYRAALSNDGRALQGKGCLARRVVRGQPVGRQQIPRALQYRAQVDRRGDEAPSGCAAGLLHRIRRAHAGGRLLLHGQPRQRPREHRRTGRRGLQRDLLRHRQRLDHQLSLCADAQDRHHHAALRATGCGHGRQCWGLPGWRVDGRIGCRAFRSDAVGGRRPTLQGRAGRPRAGADLAQLATARREPLAGLASGTGTGGRSGRGGGGRSAGGEFRRVAERARSGQRSGRADIADESVLGADRADDCRQASRRGPGSRQGFIALRGAGAH